MEDHKIKKEDIKEAFRNPTKVKGMALKEGICKAIRERLGDKSIKLIEKESKKLGFPFKLEKIRNFEWYPAGTIVEVLYILQEKFNFQEKDFAELGGISSKSSFFVKILMRYFTVPEKIVKIAAFRLWQRYFDRGEVEVCEFRDSETGGFLIARIKNFKLHPLHFFYLGYFFLGMFKLTKKFKDITVKETKSPFKGDECQEYLFRWKH